MTIRCCAILVLLALQFNSAVADEYDPNEVLFARRISSLLVEKCVSCHGADPDNIQGGLDLRTFATATAGGDSQVATILAGDAKSSPLYLAARRDSDDWSAMPPKDSEAVSDEQLKWLKQWIDGGAKWIDDEQINAISEAYNNRWSVEDGVVVKTSGGLADNWTSRRYDFDGLWAYRPVAKPDVEATAEQNPIDALLDQRRPADLSVAPAAERRQWLRRATFDLTGLPPTPEDVAAFVTDARDDDAVYAEWIDRLLASPHYGERMAQHWLDVVRYADSSGFANDYARGNAWRYRDYVVRYFNDDRPYDEFILEQIAGDEINPDDPESIIATGFLRMGPWELTGMEVAKVARQRFLDDVTNSVGETFLGHSLQCARCHDHKFDPIPTRDYYSFQAVFATTQLAERHAAFLDRENTNSFDEQRYLELRKREYEQMLEVSNEALLANALKWFEQQKRAPGKWHEAIAFVAQHNDGAVSFNAVRNRMAKIGVAEHEYPPKLVGFTPEQFGLERVARKGIERLQWEMERCQPFALAVYNGRTPRQNSVNSPTRVPDDRLTGGELENTCVLRGGDPFSPTIPVQPSALSVLDEHLRVSFPTEIEGRRTALARWIADARNPLTTRVIANRIWQWHFGKAIAGNANNFGSTGKRPTHPELLDWLAATFVENGWRFKPLHRTIMLSRAYRQSSTHPDSKQLTQLDPLRESYSVFERRRLTAEELRDAMLRVTGELNLTVGGIPTRPEINPEVALQPRQVMGTFAAAWTPSPRPADRHRRSIYTLKLRGLTLPMFEVFNSPVLDFSCERRESSTVTPQVFALWNSQASRARAMSLATDVSKTTDDPEVIVTECFERLLNRVPSEQELQWCVQAWREIEAALPDEAVEAARSVDPPPTKVRREAVEENTGERFVFDETLYANADYVPDHDSSEITRRIVALADICLTLLNTNEFVFVD